MLCKCFILTTHLQKHLNELICNYYIHYKRKQSCSYLCKGVISQIFIVKKHISNSKNSGQV